MFVLYFKYINNNNNIRSFFFTINYNKRKIYTSLAIHPKLSTGVIIIIKYTIQDSCWKLLRTKS